MTELKGIKNIYFIGIGGIGMSALARYFHSKGVEINGYDKTPTELTRELEQEGISVHYEDNIELVPKNAGLVVYTPAVPADHKELNFYRDNNYKVLKRSDVLGLISNSSFNICVAGTHGKTTISTMIAHILRDSGYGCNAFLGGIAANYNTNFWSAPMQSGGDNRDVAVIEADEYDRSFLKLSPDIAIISAMDPDHLDIYGTEEALQEAFIDFSKKLKPGGLLLNKFGLKKGSALKAANHLTYSRQNEAADVHALNVKMENGSYRFDVMIRGVLIQDIVLNMGGMHNVENAIAAITVARELEIEIDKIKAAIASFKGVRRRFEYLVKADRLVMIDDYAHHPEELSALINSAKTLFKGRKCTVIFQPHLFSRTKDLAEGFAKSLDLADEVLLLPIYPARELPVEGVTSRLIVDKIQKTHIKVLTKEELLTYMRDVYVPRMDKEFGELLIIAGAGDIDALVVPVKKIVWA